MNGSITSQFLGRRGASAIEFAITLPVLLLIVWGMIDFGRAIRLQATLNYAAQAAARCRAVNNDPAVGLCRSDSLAQTYGAAQAYGLSDVSVSISLQTCGEQAVASANFKYFMPLLSTFSGTYSATACYPV
jgi:Flp pilus assembly protein TadG